MPSAPGQDAATPAADTGAVPYWNRTEEEVASFFDGLEFVEPGFVPVSLWRPQRPEGVAEIAPPQPLDHYGGVARKP